MTSETIRRRRPVEAIKHRTNTSADCELRVRKALMRLVKTGAPFTVENVCALAGVGKTFIYDKRRSDLTKTVLAARDASQAAQTMRVELKLDQEAPSWRERALNAEALAKSLRTAVRELDARISDLTGQLYDPDGNHLAEHNAELRKLVLTLNHKLHNTDIELAKLRRSLDAARANVKRERKRNVTQIYDSPSPHDCHVRDDEVGSASRGLRNLTANLRKSTDSLRYSSSAHEIPCGTG